MTDNCPELWVSVQSHLLLDGNSLWAYGKYKVCQKSPPHPISNPTDVTWVWFTATQVTNPFIVFVTADVPWTCSRRKTNSSKNNSLHRLNFHPCLCVVGTPERQFHKTLRGCSMQPQSANYKRSKHAGDKQVPSALGLRGENKQNENIQSEDQVTQHWLYMCRADLRQLKAATGIRRGFVQIHFRLSKRVW